MTPPVLLVERIAFGILVIANVVEVPKPRVELLAVRLVVEAVVK